MNKTYCPECGIYLRDIKPEPTDDNSHIYNCYNCGSHFWILNRDNK